MLSIASLLLLQGTEALLPLVVDGNRFYQLNEDYTKAPESFTIFGVDYQPGGSSGFSLSNSNDVLSDPHSCLRDAYLLNKLGANAIRVYSVSPWVNHDECMSIFNDAGIYVLLDVNTPDSSINRLDPGSSYNHYYLNNVFGTVDAFKKYPNLMGFIAGNEIINDGPSASINPVYLRAVIRDIKQYISRWSNRTIPVGYAASDNLDYRDLTFDYLQCNANTGNSSVDSLSRADFFGINSYTWCSGVNDFKTSGYQDIIDAYNKTSIPIIFTEYGCITKRPRAFDEVDEGIYGPLSNIVSGGFVYEYSNEANNYGLVDIDDDGNVSLFKDYDNLKTAFADVNVTRTAPPASVTGTATLSNVPVCAQNGTQTSFDWSFNLPTCPGNDLIESNGGNRNVGSLVSYSTGSLNYTLVDAQGNTITPTLSYSSAFGVNYQTNVPQSILDEEVPGSATTGTVTSSATATKSTSTTSSSSSKSSASASSSSSTTKAKNGGTTTAISCLGAMAVIMAYLV